MLYVPQVRFTTQMAGMQVSWARDEDARRWHKVFAVRYGTEGGSPPLSVT